MLRCHSMIYSCKDQRLSGKLWLWEYTLDGFLEWHRPLCRETTRWKYKGTLAKIIPHVLSLRWTLLNEAKTYVLWYRVVELQKWIQSPVTNVAVLACAGEAKSCVRANLMPIPLNIHSKCLYLMNLLLLMPSWRLEMWPSPGHGRRLIRDFSIGCIRLLN